MIFRLFLYPDLDIPETFLLFSYLFTDTISAPYSITKENA